VGNYIAKLWKPGGRGVLNKGSYKGPREGVGGKFFKGSKEEKRRNKKRRENKELKKIPRRKYKNPHPLRVNSAWEGGGDAGSFLRNFQKRSARKKDMGLWRGYYLKGDKTIRNGRIRKKGGGWKGTLKKKNYRGIVGP